MSKEMKKNTCSSGNFKRLNYYEGMLLTEQDFKAEQNYFREKMKLHNRLHGYGVVWGLGLTKKCIREGSDSAEKIFIEPGYALDCAGNEIIICHPYRLPLEDKIDELLQGCKPITEKICLTVSINYCEGESEPQPQYSSAREEDDLQVKMSRICEGFYVELLPDKEIHDNCKQVNDCDCETTYRQDCLGVKECCEDEYDIILGCICIEPKRQEQDCKNVEVSEVESSTHGSVTDSANKTGNPERKLGKEFISYGSLQIYIDPCCNPPRVCRPCASPLEQWEFHKHNLLQQICKSTGIVDLVCLIGKPLSEAESFLQDRNIDRYTITSFSSDPNQLSILKNASSCVYPGSEVVLIMDELKSCILFAFSLPSPAYTIEEAVDNEQ